MASKQSCCKNLWLALPSPHLNTRLSLATSIFFSNRPRCPPRLRLTSFNLHLSGRPQSAAQLVPSICYNIASKLEVEIELKTSAEKLWRNLKEFATFFPRALPDMYESIEVLEGDGKTVGSVLLATFKPELKSVISTTKERIEFVDEEKKTLSYSFLEGEFLEYYRNFKAIISVCSKGDGSLVKYSAEFDKANEEVPDPDLFRDFAVKLFHGLDAYLLKA